MANGHGGKRPVRTNSTPKPVSGPGKLSQRTDMIPSGGAYGDRKEMVENIAAGNRATPDPQPAPQPLPMPAAPSTPLAGLHAPTERPNEPVTSGNPLGEGPGPESLNLPQRSFNATTVLSRLAQNDPTGNIEMILNDLNSRGIV